MCIQREQLCKEHHRTDCKSCPLIYRSNEAYLYKGIVQHVLLSGIKYFTNVILRTQNFLESVQDAGNTFIIFFIFMFSLDQECYDIVTAKEKKTTTIFATNMYVLLCS